MKPQLIPSSPLGKWSVGFIVMVPLLTALGTAFVQAYQTVPAGDTILEDLLTRPGVALPMLTAFASGIVALLCGLFAIFKKKDHSILTLLATLLGFLILLWVLAEVLFPH